MLICLFICYCIFVLCSFSSHCTDTNYPLPVWTIMLWICLFICYCIFVLCSFSSRCTDTNSPLPVWTYHMTARSWCPGQRIATSRSGAWTSATVTNLFLLMTTGKSCSDWSTNHVHVLCIKHGKIFM